MKILIPNRLRRPSNLCNTGLYVDRFITLTLLTDVVDIKVKSPYTTILPLSGTITWCLTWPLAIDAQHLSVYHCPLPFRGPRASLSDLDIRRAPRRPSVCSGCDVILNSRHQVIGTLSAPQASGFPSQRTSNAEH